MVADKAGCPPSEEFMELDEMPEMLEQIEPVYPDKARKEGIEGKVTIMTLVGKSGDPIKVELAKSSGYKILDKAAIKAARQAKFKPGTQGDRPVSVWVSYTVNFVLDAEAEEESSIRE
jgi:protein TonB